MPEVSIITICRNELHGIEKTCRSISEQTWRNFEWIVVDGASSDGTLDVLRKYEGQMERFISEPDSGVYAAMNKGIRLARGKYVILMNGGDAFHHPEVLEEVFGRAGFVEADVLYGDSTHVMEHGQSVWQPHSQIDSPYYFINGFLPHQSCFIRRSLFEQFGYYDETLRIAADTKQWIIFAWNRCVFRYVGVNISLYDKTGISSVRTDLLRTEMMRILNTYFHAGELALHHEASWSQTWLLLGRLPLLTAKRRGRLTRYLLFGCFPLFYSRREES